MLKTLHESALSQACGTHLCPVVLTRVRPRASLFPCQQDTQPHSSLEVADSQLSVSSEEFWDKLRGVYTRVLAEGIETSSVASQRHAGVSCRAKTPKAEKLF